MSNNINWITEPSIGDIVTAENGRQWQWNGYAWDATCCPFLALCDFEQNGFTINFLLDDEDPFNIILPYFYNENEDIYESITDEQIDGLNIFGSYIKFNEVENIWELLVSIDDIKFSTMGISGGPSGPQPAATVNDICNDYTNNGFADDGDLYFKYREGQGGFEVYYDDEYLNVAQDGFYIINDTQSIFEDDILLIWVDQGIAKYYKNVDSGSENECNFDDPIDIEFYEVNTVEIIATATSLGDEWIINSDNIISIVTTCGTEDIICSIFTEGDENVFKYTIQLIEEGFNVWITSDLKYFILNTGEEWVIAEDLFTGEPILIATMEINSENQEYPIGEWTTDSESIYSDITTGKCNDIYNEENEEPQELL